MSPILKRDVSEHVRQGRRLASAVMTGKSSDHTNGDDPSPSVSPDSAYVSSSSARKGLADPLDHLPPDSVRKGKWKAPPPFDGVNGINGIKEMPNEVSLNRNGQDEGEYPLQDGLAQTSVQDEDEHDPHDVDDHLDAHETHAMLAKPRVEEMGFRDTMDGSEPSWRGHGKWIDLRNLLVEVSLFSSQAPVEGRFANDMSALF